MILVNECRSDVSPVNISNSAARLKPCLQSEVFLEVIWKINEVFSELLESASPMHFCLNEQQLQLTRYLRLMYHKVPVCCITV